MFFYYIGFACSAVPFLKEQHLDLCCSFFRRTILLRLSLFLFGYHCSFSFKETSFFYFCVDFFNGMAYWVFSMIAVPFPKRNDICSFVPFSIIHRCCFFNGTPFAYFWSLCWFKLRMLFPVFFLVFKLQLCICAMKYKNTTYRNLQTINRYIYKALH